MRQAQKYLVIRFSSIGDIVLTTPVIRCLKLQSGAEIHIVTKKAFADVLQHNPYVDRLHTFEKDIGEVTSRLEEENFSFVFDLHNNLRSARLKRILGIPSASFNKLNLRKYLAVTMKLREMLPHVHIVDRYFNTVERTGVKNDGKGLDYFLSEADHVDISSVFGVRSPFIAVVAGGSYYTKKIPLNKLEQICSSSRIPVLLLGTKEEDKTAAALQLKFKNVVNGCGKLTLNQSASVVKQAEWVITSDTGLMHIAAAFGKKIVSVWGNTIPEFGMSPYQPVPGSRVLQVNDISCRPCSKLGYGECPLGHFKCMNEIDYSFLADITAP